MRWLGRKSANRWRREAHFCTILHSKSVQKCASERRRFADFWSSYLIYDCLKVDFSHSCRSSEFWSEIIPMDINYVCVEYFLCRKWDYADDRTCLNLWITTGVCMLGDCFHQENRFFGVWDNSSLMVLVLLGVGLGNCCSLKSWGDSPTNNEEFEVPASKILWFFCWFSSLFRDCTSYGVSLNANWASFEFSKNAYLTIFINEKMLIVQFPYMKKCLSWNFHKW